MLLLSLRRLDTGFAGCVGFPLDLVLSRGNKLPRWYWLYNKRTGLTTCEPVEHAVIDVPRGLMPDDMPDVVVAGRRRNLPNALVRSGRDQIIREETSWGDLTWLGKQARKHLPE